MPFVETIVDGQITTLRFNRPERMNAVTPAVIAELHDQLDAMARDRSCRVVILTGAGRAFCAGADLAAATDQTDGDAAYLKSWPGGLDFVALQEPLSRLVLKINEQPQPVIAALNGPAIGAGAALALAADFRIAGESARFGAGFVRVGLSSLEMGLSWSLPRIVGAGNAAELLLTGRIIDASECHRIGLVVDVVPDDELRPATLDRAGLIVRNTPFGVWLTKRGLAVSREISSLRAAVEYENRSQALVAGTADQREALSAMLAKREPHYEGPATASPPPRPAPSSTHTLTKP